MNTKQALAVAIITSLLGSAAMAQTADTSAVSVTSATPSTATQRPLTRAEVKAELARAMADGSMTRLHETYGFVPNVAVSNTGARTREEVRAEAREAARTRSSSSQFGYGG